MEGEKTIVNQQHSDGLDAEKGDAAKPSIPKSVLFICNHNVIRSPMAEALMRYHFGNKIYCASAGIRAGRPDAFVEAVLAEEGIAFFDHEPQPLDYLDDGYFDLIITLSLEAHEAALERTDVGASDVEYWEAADPTTVNGSRNQRLEAYRSVRDSLSKRILARFSEAEAS